MNRHTVTYIETDILRAGLHRNTTAPGRDVLGEACICLCHRRTDSQSHGWYESSPNASLCLMCRETWALQVQVEKVLTRSCSNENVLQYGYQTAMCPINRPAGFEGKGLGRNHNQPICFVGRAGSLTVCMYTVSLVVSLLRPILYCVSC